MTSTSDSTPAQAGPRRPGAPGTRIPALPRRPPRIRAAPGPAADPDRRHRRRGLNLDPGARPGLRREHDGERGVRRLRDRGRPGLLARRIAVRAGRLPRRRRRRRRRDHPRRQRPRRPAARRRRRPRSPWPPSPLFSRRLSGDPGATHGTHAHASPARSARPSPMRSPPCSRPPWASRTRSPRKLAVPDLTTTVLTMTLTGIGADLRAVLRAGERPGRGASPTWSAACWPSAQCWPAPGGRLPDALREPGIGAGAGAVPAGGATAAAAMAVATRPAPWRTPPARPK